MPGNISVSDRINQNGYERVKEQLGNTFSIELKDLQGKVKQGIEEKLLTDDKKITKTLEEGIKRLHDAGNKFSDAFGAESTVKNKERALGSKYEGVGFTLALQVALKKLNYYTGEVDGLYGDKTRDAVKKLQKEFEGLKVDGVAGEKTLTALLGKIQGLTGGSTTKNEKKTEETTNFRDKYPETNPDNVFTIPGLDQTKKNTGKEVKKENTNQAKAGAEVGGSKGKVGNEIKETTKNSRKIEKNESNKYFVYYGDKKLNIGFDKENEAKKLLEEFKEIEKLKGKGNKDTIKWFNAFFLGGIVFDPNSSLGDNYNINTDNYPTLESETNQKKVCDFLNGFGKEYWTGEKEKKSNKNQAKAGAEVGGKGKVETKKGSEFPIEIQSKLDVFFRANDKAPWDINYNEKPEDKTTLDLSNIPLTEKQLKDIINTIAEKPECLKNLSKLDLTSCSLTSLPPEIGKLTNLTELFIRKNKLTSISEEIFKLANLTRLWIDSNKVPTQTTVDFSKLSKLQSLSIDSNNNTIIVPIITNCIFFDAYNCGYNVKEDKKNGTKTYTKRSTK